LEHSPTLPSWPAVREGTPFPVQLPVAQSWEPRRFDRTSGPGVGDLNFCRILCLCLSEERSKLGSRSSWDIWGWPGLRERLCQKQGFHLNVLRPQLCSRGIRVGVYDPPISTGLEFLQKFTGHLWWPKILGDPQLRAPAGMRTVSPMGSRRDVRLGEAGSELTPPWVAFTALGYLPKVSWRTI
jgi:hypothetical protein